MKTSTASILFGAILVHVSIAVGFCVAYIAQFVAPTVTEFWLLAIGVSVWLCGSIPRHLKNDLTGITTKKFIVILGCCATIVGSVIVAVGINVHTSLQYSCAIILTFYEFKLSNPIQIIYKNTGQLA